MQYPNFGACIISLYAYMLETGLMNSFLFRVFLLMSHQKTVLTCISGNFTFIFQTLGLRLQHFLVSLIYFLDFSDAS
uniref:Uncharacterized protein n=1 Tax=Arundo donax TaxID=35708 RepID=A0A0A9F701_ARUDO